MCGGMKHGDHTRPVFRRGVLRYSARLSHMSQSACQSGRSPSVCWSAACVCADTCSSVQDDTHSYLNALLQFENRNARTIDGGFSDRCVNLHPHAAQLQQVDQVAHNLLVLICPAHVLTCQKPARGSSDTAQPKGDVHLMLGPPTWSWRLRSSGAPRPSAPLPRSEA